MGPMRAAVGLMRAEKKTFLWNGKVEINRLCIDITFLLRYRWSRGIGLRIGSCSGNANGGRAWTLCHLIIREQSRAGSWYCSERNQCHLLLWRKMVQFKWQLAGGELMSANGRDFCTLVAIFKYLNINVLVTRTSPCWCFNFKNISTSIMTLF